MASFRIRGGHPLCGSVTVGGRKNSAVAVLPATLLASSPSVIGNLPQIQDVTTHLHILNGLGVRVRQHGRGGLEIDPMSLKAPQSVPPALARRMRASYYLLGVLLGRFGEAVVPLPGGCDIGTRPIDQHLKGFEALGAEVVVRDGVVHATAAGPLQGAVVDLDMPSVGATINIMLAAVLAQGVTVITNAARELHVVDVATYLSAMGANIVGAGTDTIEISGVRALHGCRHAIIPDDIEAATYMIAVAATGGAARLRGVVPEHLEAVSTTLRTAGVSIREGDGCIDVSAPNRAKAVDVETRVYPGFPTDAQQPFAVLMATAAGTSSITETIWDRRFTHVAALQQMGADIRVRGDRSIIHGVPTLREAAVPATDLRAGAALIVAELVAAGKSTVSDIEHVERGYEQMAVKLRGLGASVERLGVGSGEIGGAAEVAAELGA